MACRRIGPKLFPNPMLTDCQLKPKEQLMLNFNESANIFVWKKATSKSLGDFGQPLMFWHNLLLYADSN